MLRTFLLLIALLIVVAIALIGLGVIDLRPKPGGGVTVQARDVEVGTTDANLHVPVVRMEERQIRVPDLDIDNGVDAQAPQ